MVNESYGLKNIILHDSYGKFRGRTVKLPMNSSTYIGGGNAEGKTSAITLIPIFYGQDPSRLINRSSGKLSFTDYYLPSDQSMIIYEYSNVHGTQCAVLSRGESGKLTYRFVGDTADNHLFSTAGAEKLATGTTAREMFSWLKDLQHTVSRVFYVITDYRAIIQRSQTLIKRNDDRSRLRLDAEQYGLGDQATDLTHIEKITSGLISKAMLMESLKQVICDSLLTHLHINSKPPMENLKHAITESKALNEFKSNLPVFEKCIRENNDRLRYEQSAIEAVDVLNSAIVVLRLKMETFSNKKTSLNEDLNNLDEHKVKSINEINVQISELKAEINTLNAALDRISNKQSKYEQEGMSDLSHDFDNIALLKSDLLSAREHLESLTGIRQGHIRDRDIQIAAIDNEYNKKQQSIAKKIAELNERLSALKDKHHEQEKSLIENSRNEVEQMKSEHAGALSVSHLRRKEIETTIIYLRNSNAELAVVEEFSKKLNELRDEKYFAENKFKSSQASIVTLKQTRTELDQALSDLNRQLENVKHEQRKIVEIINPKENTFISELRKQDASWHQTIGKVVNPDLLHRKDLQPLFTELKQSVYGWELDLTGVEAPLEAQQEDQLRIELSRLDLRITGLNTQILDIKKNLDVITAEIAAAEKGGSLIQSEVHNLTQAINGAIQQINSAEAQNKRELKQRKDEFNKELSSLTLAIENAARENQSALDKLKSQHRDNELELKAIRQDEIGELDNQRQQLDNVLAQEEKLMKARKKDISLSLEKMLIEDGIDPKVFQSAELEVEQAMNRIERVNHNQQHIITYRNWLDNELPTRMHKQDELNTLEKSLDKITNQLLSVRLDLDNRMGNIRSSIFSINGQIKNFENNEKEALSAIKNAEDNGIIGAGIEVITHGDITVLITNLRNVIQKVYGLRREVEKTVDKAAEIITRNHGSSQLAKQYINRIHAIEDDHELTPQVRKLTIAKILEDFTNLDIPQIERSVTQVFRTQANSLASYQESLYQLVSTVRVTSNRLHVTLNAEQQIGALSNLNIKLETKLEQSDSWTPLKNFTQEWRTRQDQDEVNINNALLIDLMNEAYMALNFIKIDEKLSSMIDMVLSMEENGRPVNIRSNADLTGASSNGMSYLAIMVIFKAITRFFCKGDNVAIAWPLDELESIDSSNYSYLFDMLKLANIYLVTATPELNRAKMWAFDNKLSLKNGVVVRIVDNALTENSLMKALTQKSAEVVHG